VQVLAPRVRGAAVQGVYIVGGCTGPARSSHELANSIGRRQGARARAPGRDYLECDVDVKKVR